MQCTLSRSLPSVFTFLFQIAHKSSLQLNVNNRQQPVHVSYFVDGQSSCLGASRGHGPRAPCSALGRARPARQQVGQLAPQPLRRQLRRQVVQPSPAQGGADKGVKMERWRSSPCRSTISKSSWRRATDSGWLRAQPLWVTTVAPLGGQAAAPHLASGSLASAGSSSIVLPTLSPKPDELYQGP